MKHYSCSLASDSLNSSMFEWTIILVFFLKKTFLVSNSSALNYWVVILYCMFYRFFFPRHPCSMGDSVLRYCSPQRRLLIYSVIWLLLCYLWNSSAQLFSGSKEGFLGTLHLCVWGDQQAWPLVSQLPGGQQTCCHRWKCNAWYFLFFI